MDLGNYLRFLENLFEIVHLVCLPGSLKEHETLKLLVLRFLQRGLCCTSEKSITSVNFNC